MTDVPGPASAPEWHLERLPPLRVTLVRLVAEESASLPALPTTSLHGAIEPALKQLCDPRRRDHRELVAGAIPEALDSSGAYAGSRGVTSATPRPWTVAPCDPVSSADPVAYQPGDVLALRLALIGERSFAGEGLLLAALGRAAMGGLGIRPHHPARPRFRLESATPLPLVPLSPPTARAAVLDCTTPLRLKRDGAFVEALDAVTLWRALVRRAQTLARAYGAGPIVDRAPAAPFELTPETSHAVPIQRWSSRHQSRMSWPGLVGIWRLRAHDQASDADLDAWWRLLRFAESVQVGSATGFGFGNVQVTPVG